MDRIPQPRPASRPASLSASIVEVSAEGALSLKEAGQTG